MGVGWFYFDSSGRSRAGDDSAEGRFATSGISPIESGRLLQRRRHGEDAADRSGPASSLQQRRACGLGSRKRERGQPPSPGLRRAKENRGFSYHFRGINPRRRAKSLKRGSERRLSNLWSALRYTRPSERSS